MNGTARAESHSSSATSLAGLGLGLAAVALAGMAIPVRQGIEEPAILGGLGFAVVTVAIFLTRRHGGVDRRLAGTLAAICSFSLVLTSGFALNQGISGSVSLPAVPASISSVFVAFLAAAGVVSIAIADYGGVGTDGLKRRGALAAGLTVVAAVGWVAAQVTGVLLALPAIFVLGGLTELQFNAIYQLGVAVGTALVAVGYLRMSDKSLSFIDLKFPTRRDLLWTIGGIFALFGAVIALSAVMSVTGVESAEHGTVEQARENPEIMLVMIPAAILIIGPFEELLYRNVLQKAMYGTFSRFGAILASSVLFAVVHVAAYATAGPGAVMASLAVVFGLSLILGVIYERTENLVVPAVVHGIYDAILFASLYFTYA